METHVVNFEAKDLATKHVTVYGDRAEVNKEIKVNLMKGTNEIVVKKLADTIHGDSIRVKGYGNAAISEVKYNEKRITREEQIKEREKDLIELLEKLKTEKNAAEQNNERLKKQREMINGIADQISKGKEKSKGDVLAPFFSENLLDNLENFFKFYVKKTAEIDSELNDVQKKLESLNDEISVIETNINDNQCCASNMAKEVSIFVKAEADGEGTLDLVYIVFNASWIPSYDIRIVAKEQATKLIYYGLIEQNTDEDWKDAKIALSTAIPSTGGQIPELGTTKVSFYKPPAPKIQPKAEEEIAVGSSAEHIKAAVAPMARARLMSVEYDADVMQHELTKVKENVTSTTFEIENPTTIPSDSASHKVTIAMVDFKPEFHYETVPSKSPLAYYTAKLTNTSNYPFLAGPTAIFDDGNFVAKGEMKAVNANEKFKVSLGVDPAIKIEYKAARKFHEESGILTKSHLLTHEQRIVVINTKSEPIQLVVLEPLPQSTEEKLKVTLIEPNPSKNDKFTSAAINKENNVEWQLTMAANDKRELVFKYNIDYPKSEQLDFKEE